MRILIGICALALALGSGMACSKKKKSGGGGGESGGMGGSGPSKSSGLSTESKTFTLGPLQIKVDVPKGWKEHKFGATSKLFYGPGSGLYKSNFRLGAACQGSCSKIAENIKAAGQKQFKSHRKSFKPAKLVKDEALPGGGHVFHISMTSHGKPAHHYELYRFQAGWKRAAMCSAMLLKQDAVHIDKFKAICMKMTATAIKE